MKILKTMFAVLVVSMFSTTAFAEVPVQAQRGLEKAEMHKRAKDKKESKADKTEKGAKSAKAAKATKEVKSAKEVNGADRGALRELETRKHLARIIKIDRLAENAMRHSNDRLLARTKLIRAKEDARYERALERLNTSGRTHVGSSKGD